MYRTAARSVARPAARNMRSLQARVAVPRRFASSSASPADKPRSWKSGAVRWGLAGAALYYYGTSPVFAEEAAPQTVAAPPPFTDADLPTVDSVLEEKRKQIQAKLEKQHSTPPSTTQSPEQSATDPKPSSPQTLAEDANSAASGAGALEEEAGQQGAFNPETGEINWDCPCLGGMAHGPCGEEFKTAFSCFVYSDVEPKGMDCIEKFQGMQECFRQYPEIYGAELSDEEDADEAPAPAHEAASTQEVAPTPQAVPAPEAASESETFQKLREDSSSTSNINSAVDATSANTSLHSSSGHEGVPAKWDDATAANDAAQKKVEEQKPANVQKE